MPAPPDPRRSAAALAYALLAGDWQPSSMTAAVRSVLLRPRPLPPPVRAEVDEWVAEVVDEVRWRFPRPPADAASELVALLTASEPLDRLLRFGPQDLTLHPPTAAMTRDPWSLPRLDTVADLAGWLELSVPRLLWLADPQRRLRRARPGPLHTYERVWIRRPDRLPRLLEAPTPALKRVQRALLEGLVGAIPTHPGAHGFVAGRSVLTHAAPHVQRGTLISLDLRSFFSSVSAARVRGVFRAAGYPEGVAALLAGLTTTPTPVRVLAAMPPGGSAEERHRLGALLRDGHLAQGAPTSPAVANAVCFRLDLRLSAYAAATGLRYSRYADDLAFSSGPRLVRAQVERFLARVAAVVREEGFVLNPTKTRVRGRSGQQRVTGLVVNERANVPRRELDQLRAVLHDAVLHGPEAANRAGHLEFRRHLEGRVAWVAAVNPGRAARVESLLSRIVWDDTPIG